jgi:16S rRNA C1402 (ribose-2'-O) methylase RsmI
MILDKESEKQTITLTTNKPIGNHLHLTFLFIGFAKQERKKHKLLHRKNNTATLIAYQTPKLNTDH